MNKTHSKRQVILSYSGDSTRFYLVSRRFGVNVVWHQSSCAFEAGFRMCELPQIDCVIVDAFTAGGPSPHYKMGVVSMLNKMSEKRFCDIPLILIDGGFCITSQVKRACTYLMRKEKPHAHPDEAPVLNTEELEQAVRAVLNMELAHA